MEKPTITTDRGNREYKLPLKKWWKYLPDNYPRKKPYGRQKPKTRIRRK